MPRRKKEELPQEEIRVIKTPPLVKGLRDVLPNDEKYWDFIDDQLRRIVSDYSFRRISTPVLEKFELFNHTLFKQSGLIEKELFYFIDHGEKLALRPESTVSVARAYVEHNLNNQILPLKVYYQGPVFRQTRGEGDRLRQFTMAGFEIIGDKNPALDAEMIIISYYLMQNLKLAVDVKLNSVGCQVCRPEYAKALLGYLRSKRTQICADCKKRTVKDALKFLTCRNPKCMKVREDAPQMMDWLCDDCRNHLFKVLEYLDELKIPYQLDPSLLRTYDFYNRTVFEIYPSGRKDEDGEPLSLAGGGRYDTLIQMLGGNPTPATGFSVGIERLVNMMKLTRAELPPVAGPDVYVAQISELARQKTFSFFEALRAERFSVRANLSKSSLKAQLDTAIKLGAKIVLILGQKEVLEGTVIMRDMESGNQEVINMNRVVPEVKKKLKEKMMKELKMM